MEEIRLNKIGVCFANMTVFFMALRKVALGVTILLLRFNPMIMIFTFNFTA